MGTVKVGRASWLRQFLVPGARDGNSLGELQELETRGTGVKEVRRGAGSEQGPDCIRPWQGKCISFLVTKCVLIPSGSKITCSNTGCGRLGEIRNFLNDLMIKLCHEST